MFEDRTPENIHAEILAGMGDKVQTREGSFAAEMTGPVAVEIAKAYGAIRAMLPAFYVDEDSGGFIDLAANPNGITRKQGTKAKAVIHLTGRAQMTISAGTVFLTEDGLEFALDEDVTIGANGQGEGTVTAAEIGDAYNVPEGALTQMVMTLTGLTAWTSGAATGGTDQESDRDLVGRFYDSLRKPATSGNRYHYEKWALEVDGVGAAKVFPKWNGPGTVKVLLIGPNRRSVDQSVVTAVANHIEEERPIGPKYITVESAGEVAINVTATLTLNGSVSLADIQTRYKAKLEEYLQSVAFESYTVLFNRIAFLLMDVGGVTDYTSLTVNGGTSNVGIQEDKVPVIGTVTLT